jgi:AcrR family transcriptional regulator
VTDGQVRRGRPRSEKARRAILDAADELLLQQGLDAVSMDEVAERAGTSKATIYRWWPSKHVLALDALREAWDRAVGPLPDTGSLRSDLHAVVRPWVKLLTSSPYGRAVAELVGEVHRSPDFAAAWRTEFIGPRRQRGREVFARAVERGEVRAGTDVDTALDLIFGPLYHRLLHGHLPLTASFAGQIVDIVVDGVLIRSA